MRSRPRTRPPAESAGGGCVCARGNLQQGRQLGRVLGEARQGLRRRRALHEVVQTDGERIFEAD